MTFGTSGTNPTVSGYTDEDLDLHYTGAQFGEALAPLLDIPALPNLPTAEFAPAGGMRPTSSTINTPALPLSTVQVNGNSKSSSNSQHGYEIRNNQTGDVRKYGISGRPLNKNGSSPRANRQVNQLNKQAGANIYSAKVLKKNMAGRVKALNWEKGKTKAYKKSNPENRNPTGNIRPQTD